jgi:DNA-directed RNA polymerase II subunit RPB1
MSIYKELSPTNEIDNIKGIRFCILSPEEIKRLSVAEIYKTDTYVATEPVVNGLFDPRMGVLDHNKVCQTCEQKNTFCPGHFGHINLSKPVFYIQFFDVVKKLLKCVCFRCSKLLLNPDSDQVKAILNRKYSRQKRWELLYKLCSKIKRCGAETMDGCGAKQPDKIYREPIVKIIMEWKELAEESRKQVMSAEEILRILKRISDKDAEILGFSKKYNRPEWMICTVLAVPPPAVRPSVRTDTGQRSEDDLTHKLCDIVKSNNSLKSKIEKGASKEQVDIATQVLQYHVATFIDNKIPGINPAQQRTGRLLKSLTERLKSKDGRIRGNLMGKRVDFSARSVITPDPNISIDELGVPLKIAMNLTFPEIVNKHNREKLTQYVINGPDVYPGSKFIRKGNWTKALKNMPNRTNIILDDGDVVDRHLIDGDYVLFNRQPSLHKYSMLCHRVKVMPFNTFRLNVCVCPLYNSDFDGDEMNMHVPQSITTANELIELAAVPNLIISVRECKPIVAIVQDVALGVYRFTKSSVQLTQKQMFNLMANNIKFTGIIPEPAYKNGDIMKWTGRQALSTIIPKNINIRSPNKSFEETDTNKDLENFVIIENGELIQGIVDKTIYQNRTKGLVHSIYNECSPHETRIFFDNTQKLICDWLVTSGFSVGISDLVVDEATNIKLKEMIHDMKVSVYDVIRDIHMGTFENKSINSNSIFFEEEVNKILNQTISKVGKVALSNLNDLYNRMINMVKAGSKGSIINVSQMVACLGQQNVDGKRIPYGFEDRTLPHYTKYDDGPESRGFVENSFMTGLTPQQFFFHSMGGREGLIDTAVKTSETGYIQRKLVKAMEDCKINYDYTVRNASGSIIQFLYGEDGMDATKIESQPLLYIDMDYVKLKNDYHLSKHDNFMYILEDDIIKEIDNDIDFENRMKEHFEQVLKDREFMIKDVFNSIKETSIMYPVSFMRIINNAKALYNKYEKEILSDLSPLYVLDTINKLSTDLFINKNNRGNKFIGILIRCYLSPKKVLFNYKFSKMAFDNIIQQIRLRFYDAIAHPSEMVGVIAAQSIGEPCTQMSQLKSTIIRITGKDNYSYSGPIGEFIDNLIDKNKENVINIGNDSIVMDLKDTYNIIGVSDDEKTSWKKISQISRHHANGGMVKVYTRSGKITTATLTHSFLKRTEKGIEAILGSDLKVGLRIPVAKYIAEVENPLTNYTIGKYGNVILDNDMGWLCGVYIADGNVSGNGIKITKCIPEYYNNLIKIVKNKFDKTISQRFTERSNFPGDDKSYKGVENNFNCKELSNFFGDNFGRGSENKKVPAWVYGCSKEFISGLIQGYFDGDGNVNCDKGKGIIRAGSISEELINDMIVLLAYFGIFGSKCLEWSKTGKVKKPFHTIQISRKYAKEFNDKIGFIVQEKAINLQELIQYVERSDIHSDQEQIDKIPELGNIISSIGKQLELPGQSRLYGRWEKKNSIGRKTLLKYIKIFEDENNINKISDVSDKITLLKQAAYSDVVWDEIVELEYLDDPKEYVYDFTVPGNDSFMVDACILVHNTLNTFHLSGVSSASKAVRGVPRIKELLSVTKNIKSPALTIYIKDEFNKDKKKCKEILNTIETTYFKDIVSSTKIFYDPDDFNSTIDDDKLFLSTYSEFINQEMITVNALSPWLLRMEFEKEKLVEYDISMIDIYHVLQNFYDNNINAMFSDDNAKKLVFRIKIYEEEDPEKDIITELKALEKNIMESLIIKGIKKINKVSMNKKESMQYVDDTMTFDKTYEWILESSGSNLLDILCHRMVDVCRTISNNINEIYEIFGIEASRQALYNEIWEVIKDADLYVNYRHLALLVDTMTNKGYLLSIDRHGINRVDIGPLAKSSFEETTDMLIKAGIFSEVDKINGVSANIMLGQIPPCGTGDTDIIIDELKLMELISQYEETEEDESIIAVDESVKAAACSSDNLTFDFTMPEIDETIVKKELGIKIV